MKDRILRFSKSLLNFTVVNESIYTLFSSPINKIGLSLNVWRQDSFSIQNDYIFEVWEEIAGLLHYKSNYFILNHYVWGDVEDLMRKEGDVFIMRWGEQLFDNHILVPILQAWYEVYLRKPGKLENSNFYIDIYPMIAWIGTFIVLLLIPCLVWLFYTLDWRFRLQRKCTALIECAFDIMTALANQGSAASPDTHSFRIFGLSIVLFSFFIWLIYSSLLIAFLSISFSSLPFKDLDDVIRINTHQVCIKYDTLAFGDVTYVNETTDTQHLLPKWEGHVNGTGCPNNSKLFLEAACHNDVVVMDSRGITEIKVSCELVKMGPKYHVGYIYLSTNKKFKYTQDINSVITKIWNFGLLRRFKVKYFVPFILPETEEYKEVTFGNISGPLYFYLASIACTVFVLFFEILLYRLMHLKQRDPSEIRSFDIHLPFLH